MTTVLQTQLYSVLVVAKITKDTFLFMATAQIYLFDPFHVVAILIMASLKCLVSEIFHSPDSDVVMKRIWVFKNSVKKKVAITLPSKL